MSLRILYDHQEGKAVMYDSVTDTALGPVLGWGDHMRSPIDQMREFIEWLEERKIDPRDVGPSVLENLTNEYKGRNLAH